MSIPLSRTLEFLLFPPGNLLVFLLLAVLLYRWRGAMLAVLVIGILQAIVFSLPVVAERLMRRAGTAISPTPRTLVATTATRSHCGIGFRAQPRSGGIQRQDERQH